MRAGGCPGSPRGPHRPREQRGRGAEGAAAPRAQAGQRSPLQTRSRDPRHSIRPGTGPWVQDVTRDRVLGNPRVPKGARHRRHRSPSPRSRGADISEHLAPVKLDDLSEAVGQGRGKGPSVEIKKEDTGEGSEGEGLSRRRALLPPRCPCPPVALRHTGSPGRGGGSGRGRSPHRGPGSPLPGWKRGREPAQPAEPGWGPGLAFGVAEVAPWPCPAPRDPGAAERSGEQIGMPGTRPGPGPSISPLAFEPSTHKSGGAGEGQRHAQITQMNLPNKYI